MKTKFVIIVSSLFLISCLEGVIEEVHSGFDISAWAAQEEFEDFDGELFIGGVKNGVFIPTESIPLSKRGKSTSTFYSDKNNSKVYYFDENNWNPNFDAIKNIPSESYYFMLKISENRQEIIKWGEGIETAFRIHNSIDVIEFPLSIVIWDDKITISTRTTSKYRVPNDTIRVLPKNYEYEPL